MPGGMVDGVEEAAGVGDGQLLVQLL